jgi:hypothetical protein
MPIKEKAHLSGGPIPEFLSLQDSPDTKVSPLELQAFCLIRRFACGIRGKAATDSDGRRPPIPIEGGHPIRTKAATLLIG